MGRCCWIGAASRRMLACGHSRGVTSMETGPIRLRQLPSAAKHLLSPHVAFEIGWRFGAAADWNRVGTSSASQRTDNPLMNYFVAHNTGAGIWKWLHYFDVYHTALQE